MDASALNNPRLKALIEESNTSADNDGMTYSKRLLDKHALQIGGKEERTKAMANELVAKLTFLCWDKCVTGSVGSSFSRSETSCLSNCAKRFAEVKMMTMQRFTGRSS